MFSFGTIDRGFCILRGIFSISNLAIEKRSLWRFAVLVLDRYEIPALPILLLLSHTAHILGTMCFDVIEVDC